MSTSSSTSSPISTPTVAAVAPPPPAPPASVPYDHLFKVLMIGDAGVGKSSMLLRFTDDSFDDHIQSTIGVDFKVKHLDVLSKRIKLTIWDTAGQERFRTLTSSYYRGAQGVILVYDVTRRDSFEHLEQWLKEVKLYSPNNGEGVVKVLVGNKVDLAETKMIPREEAEQWARTQGMLFLEASAKTRTGIKQCFIEAVQKILEDPDLLLNTVPGQRTNQGGMTLRNPARLNQTNNTHSSGSRYNDPNDGSYAGGCC